MEAAAPVVVHVESIQTAVPARAAGSGRSLPIAVTGAPPLVAAELQRRFRTVLYYRGAGAGGELEAAAWVKESLSAALADHPEMAGRLHHRCVGDGDGHRLWEVKLTDTGVRLVHASVEATMAAFLHASGADRERMEAALAMWNDVDVREPDICAPFFMQLTRFQDGGYAIGASCSLLLADPLSLASFLKTWARKHAELQAQNKVVVNAVIQYTRYLHGASAAAKHVKSIPLNTGAAGGDNMTTTTVLFRAAGCGADASDHRAIAAACVAETSERPGARAPPRVTVMARDDDGSGGPSVQTCAAADGGDHKVCHVQNGHAPRVARWRDEAGLEELVLEGRKPVQVSYSVISPCADEGLVVMMPRDGAELLITATVPNDV
ncbi:unnamed protein product [Urochloa humidicola]